MALRVKDRPDLARDPHSKAIINVSDRARAQHTENRQAAIADKTRIEYVEREISSLKEQTQNTNQLLQQILEKLDKD